MNEMNESHVVPSRKRGLQYSDILLIVLALVPATTVFCAFVLRILVEGSYFVGKVIFFSAPVVWVLVDRWTFKELIDRWGLRFQRRDLYWGIGSGLFISLLIIAGYGFYFRKVLDAEGIIATLPPLLIHNFWISALGVSFLNSLAEEYFWRAFLLERTAQRTGWKIAVFLNGLLFGLHHIILLACFFPFAPALLFALGTSCGGWIWSIMRMKGLSIWSCYLSHILADLAVMIVGYIMLF